MKTLKVLLGALALAVLVPVATAEAQDGERRRGRRGQWMERMLEQMKSELKLTDDQAKKIAAMWEEQSTARREMFRKMREEGGGFDRDKMREMFQKAREDSNKKLKEILTEEQFKDYEKLQENMRGRFGRRGRGARGERGRRGRRGFNPRRQKEEALKLLKLNEEEAAVLVPMIDKILETRRTLQQELRTKREAFVASVKTTEDEAKLKELLAQFRKDREETRAKIKKAQDELIEVLTPRQEAVLAAFELIS